MSFQPDLFVPDEPADGIEDRPPSTYSADPESVRAELHRILDEARAAEVIPWQPRKLAFYRTVFPQMSRWLPEEEASQLCFAFETELQRLKAA
jgi:hypothetical protein